MRKKIMNTLKIKIIAIITLLFIQGNFAQDSTAKAQSSPPPKESAAKKNEQSSPPPKEGTTQSDGQSSPLSSPESEKKSPSPTETKKAQPQKASTQGTKTELRADQIPENLKKFIKQEPNEEKQSTPTPSKTKNGQSLPLSAPESEKKSPSPKEGTAQNDEQSSPPPKEGDGQSSPLSSPKSEKESPPLKTTTTPEEPKKDSIAAQQKEEPALTQDTTTKAAKLDSPPKQKDKASKPDSATVKKTVLKKIQDDQSKSKEPKTTKDTQGQSSPLSAPEPEKKSPKTTKAPQGQSSPLSSPESKKKSPLSSEHPPLAPGVSKDKPKYEHPIVYEQANNSRTLDGKKLIDLPLDAVLKEVLLHNQDVLGAKYEWRASEHKTSSAYGAYEPKVVGSYKRGSFQKIRSRHFGETESYSLGIEGNTPIGTSYNLGMSLDGVNHETYQYSEPRTFSGLTVTQPLLKNLWYGSPWSELSLASLEEKVSFHNYRSNIMQILYEVESAYWDLSFNQNKFKFAQESMEIARLMVDDANTRLRAGKMSSQDVVEAKAGLSLRRRNMEDVKRELWESMNRLKTMLSSERWGENLYVAAEANLFVQDSLLKTNVYNMIDSSLFYDVQPDILILSYEEEREQEVIQQRKNGLLPTLNAEFRYGYHGTTEYGSGISDHINETTRLSWDAGLRLEIPIILGHRERNELKMAKFNKKRVAQSKKSTVYEIRSTLTLLKDRLSSLQKRIRNAREVVDYREQILGMEMKKLQRGKSNYRLIFEYEEELARAREWELESNVLFKKSLLQYSRISGALLLDRELEYYKDGEFRFAGIIDRNSEKINNANQGDK